MVFIHRIVSFMSVHNRFSFRFADADRMEEREDKVGFLANDTLSPHPVKYGRAPRHSCVGGEQA